MKDTCVNKDLPLIFHSDGNLMEIIEELIQIGIDALNPIEPQAMNIVELKQKYGEQLCLTGNIDMDYPLSRGSPSEVRRQVQERLKQLAPGGGYCLGSSNSIAHYVPLENFKALITTVLEEGWY